MKLLALALALALALEQPHMRVGPEELQAPPKATTKTEAASALMETAELGALEDDPCASNPCAQQGMTCVPDSWGAYQCICPSGTECVNDGLPTPTPAPTQTVHRATASTAPSAASPPLPADGPSLPEELQAPPKATTAIFGARTEVTGTKKHGSGRGARQADVAKKAISTNEKVHGTESRIPPGRAH